MKMIILFTIIILSLIIVPNVKGINMESPRFKIQFGNINETSGTKASQNYTITDTVGQLAAGKFQSQGFIAKAGFQYLHSISPFRFTLSNSSLDFGSLNPKTFAVVKTNLTVVPGSVAKYQVTVTEEGPLKSLAGNIIRNTFCNSGHDTCTEEFAKLWDSVSSFGFGYHIDGEDVPADFISTNHFRPFSDHASGIAPTIIMSSSNINKIRRSTMTFKINVSPDQQAGTYETIISFVATPGF